MDGYDDDDWTTLRNGIQHRFMASGIGGLLDAFRKTHDALHRSWKKDHGTPGYVERDWMTLGYAISDAENAIRHHGELLPISISGGNRGDRDLQFIPTIRDRPTSAVSVAEVDALCVAIANVSGQPAERHLISLLRRLAPGSDVLRRLDELDLERDRERAQDDAARGASIAAT
jgi:hypothetical protein